MSEKPKRVPKMPVQLMVYTYGLSKKHRRLTARVFRLILDQYVNENKRIFVCVD